MAVAAQAKQNDLGPAFFARLERFVHRCPDRRAPIPAPAESPLESKTTSPAICLRQTRCRLGANGRLRAAQAPRGLVLGTGEEVPQGQSIRARLVILELGAGKVDSGLAEQVSTGGAGRTFGGVHGRLRALGCRPV